MIRMIFARMGIQNAGKFPNAFVEEGLRIMAGRTEVAAYASVVDQAARQGDAAAMAILHRAAEDLADTFADSVDTIRSRTLAVPLVATGSVLMHSDCYWERFRDTALSIAPRVRPVRLHGPPATGVALAGLCQIKRCTPDDPRIVRTREHLLRSLADHIGNHRETTAA